MHRGIYFSSVSLLFLFGKCVFADRIDLFRTILAKDSAIDSSRLEMRQWIIPDLSGDPGSIIKEHLGPDQWDKKNAAETISSLIRATTGKDGVPVAVIKTVERGKAYRTDLVIKKVSHFIYQSDGELYRELSPSQLDLGDEYSHTSQYRLEDLDLTIGRFQKRELIAGDDLGNIFLTFKVNERVQSTFYFNSDLSVREVVSTDGGVEFFHRWFVSAPDKGNLSLGAIIKSVVTSPGHYMIEILDVISAGVNTNIQDAEVKLPQLGPSFTVVDHRSNPSRVLRRADLPSSIFDESAEAQSSSIDQSTIQAAWPEDGTVVADTSPLAAAPATHSSGVFDFRGILIYSCLAFILLGIISATWAIFGNKKSGTPPASQD